MKRALVLLAAVAALVSSPDPARAQAGGGLAIGLRLGAYFPSDPDVSDRFGDVIPIVGIARAVAPSPGSFALFPNLEISGARSGSDRFLIIPLTLAAEYQLPVTGVAVPFVRAEGGIAYYDYRMRIDTATVARGREFGPAAAVEAGVGVTQHLRASARYRIFQAYDGFDFSGLELNAVIGALRIF
jgi:hypothetical protein